MDQGSPSVTSTEELSPLEKPSTPAGSFPRLAYFIAAGLMLVIILQVGLVFKLKSQNSSITAERDRAMESLAMMSLRLNSFEVKDSAYQAARITVAWDALQNLGVVTAQNLPAPPAGHNYQLWILDPAALTPVNAGLIYPDKPSAYFKAQSVSTINPGFAITLEPEQGSPQPTGSILFAVEPGQ